MGSKVEKHNTLVLVTLQKRDHITLHLFCKCQVFLVGKERVGSLRDVEYN